MFSTDDNNYILTITFINYSDYRTRLCSTVTNSPWSWMQSPHKFNILYWDILLSTEDNNKLTITFIHHGDYRTRLCSIVTNSPWSWLQSPRKYYILFNIPLKLLSTNDIYELTIILANHGDYRVRLCSTVTNSRWSWLQCNLKKKVTYWP